MTGHIDQTKINIRANDDGGELDSGGQDERGNPIGALAYSNTLPSAHGGAETQSRTWHIFLGGNIFCTKLCDPNAPNASGLCRHTLDTCKRARSPLHACADAEIAATQWDAT